MGVTVDLPVAIALSNMFLTVVGGIIFVMRIEGRQNVQDVILNMLSKRVDTMGDTLKLVAGQSFEIAQLTKTVEELRRGVGWKHDPLNRSTVEGEYR
jgi:hypothetical protein